MYELANFYVCYHLTKYRHQKVWTLVSLCASTWFEVYVASHISTAILRSKGQNSLRDANLRKGTSNDSRTLNTQQPCQNSDSWQDWWCWTPSWLVSILKHHDLQHVIYSLLSQHGINMAETSFDHLQAWKGKPPKKLPLQKV